MIPLRPHPSTPEDALHAVALAERTAVGDLHLRYVIDGALDAIRLPPTSPPQRSDRLWEHTCAEAFVAAEGAPPYVELNIAPSCAWAAYAFAAYRAPAPPPALTPTPRIDVRREPGTLTFDVCFALADLGPAYRDAALRVGLSLVVETTDGRLSYWALHHPSARPDFHHADGFVLRLAERARGSST